MPRIFVDSDVLIMAARGAPPLRDAALSWLEDPDHVLLTSPFVYLETVPKAAFHRRDLELEFYRIYFRHAEWLNKTSSIVDEAVEISTRSGVGPMDSLHVAAAALMQADLLVAAEKPGKSIYHADSVPVVYLTT